jgi:hypothetical protein
MAKRWIPSKLSERKRDNIAKALSKVGFILPGSLADCEPYSIEAKRIRDLIARLEDITIDIVENDNRWNQK